MSLDAHARRAAAALHDSAETVDPFGRLGDLQRVARRRAQAQVVLAFVLVLALVVAGVLAVRNDLEVVGPLPSRATIPVGRQPTTVVIGQGAVWVACPQDNLVRRIDPQTNQEVATLRVAQPQDIALGFGAVWVSSERSGTVLRIDPRTNSATPIRVAGKPNAIAVGADAVWVKNSDRRTIQRIDPQTDTVTATLPVASGLYGLAVDDHWLWTVDFPGDTVTRLRVPE